MQYNQFFILPFKNTPGQLVFGRDMILNIKHKANWEFICQRKQSVIDQNNQAENAKWIPHNYKIGDQVLQKRNRE